MEKSATAQGFMKKSLEIHRAKNTLEVSGAIQMLEELVRKYEEHREKKYDNDFKLQRLYDILWTMMSSTGRAGMELGSM